MVSYQACKACLNCQIGRLCSASRQKHVLSNAANFELHFLATEEGLGSVPVEQGANSHHCQIEEMRRRTSRSHCFAAVYASVRLFKGRQHGMGEASDKIGSEKCGIEAHHSV